MDAREGALAYLDAMPVALRAYVKDATRPFDLQLRMMPGQIAGRSPITATQPVEARIRCVEAIGKLFEDPKRAEAIASAIGGLQRAKQALDEAQEKALRAAGLVTREDFKDAGKRISALKRKVRELADELDELIAQQKK